MGAFEDLLKRQGYVKLDHYGLVLTPDDRILSTRPAVLDDGLGGKVVGWADGDLAAAELDHWGAAAKPAAAKRVAANHGLQSLPPAPPMRTARGTAPPLPGVTKPAVVAAEPVVEEDEWEWEIAMARVRAVADEVQTAAASIATSFTAPSSRKPGTAPKQTMMMPAFAPNPPITPAAGPQLASGSGPIYAAPSDPMAAWGSTETLQAGWDATRESTSQVMSPAAKSLAVVKTSVRAITPRGVPVASSSSRSTVIPVPQLPVVAKGTDLRSFNPGAPPPRLATQPRLAARAALGTQAPPARRVMAAQSEDTVVTGAVLQAANEDHTSPYVTLPSEVKPTGFAHTKRVAAKHR